MGKNLEQTIPVLFSAFEIILPGEVLERFANAAVDELSNFHFGLGLYIRNNILTPESVLYSAFLGAGINCKDDMSDMILQLFHQYLNEK